MCEQDNIFEALVEERICAGMSVCCSARLGSGNIYNKSLQRLAVPVTLGHVEAHRVAGGVGRGAGVVTGVVRPRLVDGQRRHHLDRSQVTQVTGDR